MGAAREPDQADFDLERFIDMFDTAMTSEDPRVIETLRKLLMIVALTAPESNNEHGRNYGPLRRMFDDMHNLNRSIGRLQDEINDIRYRERPQVESRPWGGHDKYTMAAAANLAQSIDRDVMRQLSTQTATAINGGDWPKGKLTK
jgi:hypothetical protein